MKSCLLVGFHGCDARRVENIRAENFKCGSSDDLWLGKGAYFFGEGISDPVDDAAKWAIFASGIKGSANRHYSEYAVLRAEISPGKLLDMTVDEGKKAANVVRERVRARLETMEGTPRLKGFEDSTIIHFLVENMGYDVVIHDFYTRFDREIVLNIRSRFPNTRHISVFNPESCIDKRSITVIRTGPTTPP